MKPEKPLTKAQIIARRHAELGKCQAMTQNKRTPTQCSKWAVELVGEGAYCGQHAEAIAESEDAAARAARVKAVLDARLDEYLAWVAAHPSVHDTRVGMSLLQRILEQMRRAT